MESVLASSAPPSGLPAGEYEVFLSFRGPDVRNTFADHLYTSLSRAKIRTFRDEEELRKGDGIAPSLIRAIPESKIYIPILTKQYASSKWCLQELAQMVECWNQNKGHLILPIFYFVDPRDVRHQHGPYQEAFQQHTQKHSPETVGNWKEALQEIGQMKGWHVTESDSQVLPNLCCLRLLHCESIPTDIYTKKLTVLDLEECDVKDNWKGWNRIKAAAKLKAVNLPRCSQLTRAPDLSPCASLELINFEESGRMEGQLHIGNFKNLKTLRLRWTKITGLIIRGNDMGKLQRLEEMDSRYRGHQIEIPRLPRSLKRLTISSSNGVPNLLELTSLESLRTMSVGSCTVLQRLPSLANLMKLKDLEVCQCPNLVQIQGIGEIGESLSRLTINSCYRLANLDGLLQLLGGLEDLTLNQQSFGGKPSPDLSGLINLKRLSILYSPHLTELTGLERLVSLELLSLEGCTSIRHLPDMSGLSNLKTLDLTYCESLIDPPTGIEGLESLQQLLMPNCRSITRLLNLSGLKSLETLDLNSCIALTEVKGVEGLASLTSLRMCGCTSIKELGNLSGLKKLKQLDIEGCTKLTKVNGLEELDGLQILDMEKRMRVKYLAKSAARYGKGLASRFILGFAGAADGSSPT
ncbi:unnamed protein product [Linum tenue]|uniref:TIR domain-containing protein n=1 Tax=Linum tenue TaxID=586396 RepID=A0AAV0MHM7_9ROSI|nr:unnamed protein product [Linum tenue]